MSDSEYSEYSEYSNYSDYSDKSSYSDSVYDENNTEIPLKKIFSPKEICQYTKIRNFFEKECPKEKIKKIIKIINMKSSISLRILDFFVSKYSKKRSKIDFSTVGKPNFDVRISYEAQLKSCKKRGFDPFKRKKKFYHTYFDKYKILTTIGQLNFFKWAIENKVIEYVINNKKDITDEMKKNTKTNKEDKKKKKKKDKSVVKVHKNVSVRIEKKNNSDSDCEMVLDIM